MKWLFDQGPAARYWTLRDLLARSESDAEVIAARDSIASWSPVAGLLDEQHPDGYWGFAEEPYWPKWKASVWQLILLAELGLRGSHPQVRKGCEHFLNIAGSQNRSWPPPDSADVSTSWGLWEPCVTGNMARTLTVFGYDEDPVVKDMFEWLVRYQLPDGGWNCETGEWGKEVCHSSFMSTIEPLWAFSSLPRGLWPKGGRDAVDRAVEFMLMHRLFKSDKTGKVIHEEWTKLHFPLFYFYDILHGLRVLSALGYVDDERTKDALNLLLSKRLPDGTWPMESTYLRTLRRNFVKDPQTGEWKEAKEPGVDLSNIHNSKGTVAEVPAVYGLLGELGKANPWITLNALRVLKTGE